MRYNEKGEKMLKKDKKERKQLEFVSIEALIPKEHLLRKIDAAVDFKKNI